GLAAAATAIAAAVSGTLALARFGTVGKGHRVCSASCAGERIGAIRLPIPFRSFSGGRPGEHCAKASSIAFGHPTTAGATFPGRAMVLLQQHPRVAPDRGGSARVRTGLTGGGIMAGLEGATDGAVSFVNPGERLR